MYKIVWLYVYKNNHASSLLLVATFKMKVCPAGSYLDIICLEYLLCAVKRMHNFYRVEEAKNTEKKNEMSASLS